LTRYALPEDLQLAPEAGFNQHLAKLPDLDKLAQILARVPRPERRRVQDVHHASNGSASAVSLASGIAMTSPLFSPFRIGKLDLENRLICLPLYLAYPDTDHQVNDLVLDYYAEVAASGVGMVVVENATVAPRGLCNPRTLLTSDDHADDRFVPGLARLASTIKQRGPKAVLQIHHAGRYAKAPARAAWIR